MFDPAELAVLRRAAEEITSETGKSQAGIRNPLSSDDRFQTAAQSVAIRGLIEPASPSDQKKLPPVGIEPT